jgi:hypothetical protein
MLSASFGLMYMFEGLNGTHLWCPVSLQEMYRESLSFCQDMRINAPKGIYKLTAAPKRCWRLFLKCPKVLATFSATLKGYWRHTEKSQNYI